MVIAGKSKGFTGTISRVLTKEDQVIIDGANISKRHRKPTQQARTGQIIEKPMPIHVSNVMIIDPKSGKPTRIAVKKDAKGKRSRVGKSGQDLK